MKRRMAAAVAGCCVMHVLAVSGLLGATSGWWLALVLPVAISAALMAVRSRHAVHG